MPNYCSNTIETTNPTLIAALEEAHHEDKGLFSLLVPIPEELSGIESGGTNDIHGNYVRLWRDTPEGAVAVSEEEQAALKEKYGTASWFEWCVYHGWGTKWDAEVGHLEITEEDGQRKATAWFSTAWSPPEPWLKTVMEEHPEGRTALAYSEGGMGFFGVLIYKDGEAVEEWTNSDNYWSDELDEDECALPTTLCQDFLDRWGLH